MYRGRWLPGAQRQLLNTIESDEESKLNDERDEDEDFIAIKIIPFDENDAKELCKV